MKFCRKAQKSIEYFKKRLAKSENRSTLYEQRHKSGCGSVWLERCGRDAEAGGSNPLTPTIFFAQVPGNREQSSAKASNSFDKSWICPQLLFLLLGVFCCTKNDDCPLAAVAFASRSLVGGCRCCRNGSLRLRLCVAQSG